MIPLLKMACQQPVFWESESTVNSQPEDSGPLVVPLGTWQLHQSANCSSSRKLDGLQVGLSANHWLQNYRKDVYAMTTMRSALRAEVLSRPVCGMREEDVIEQVANLIKSGRWHICEPAMRVYAVAVVQQPAVASVPRRAAPSSAPPPPVSIAPDPDSLPANADQAATAATMSLASELGVPFCEECFKQALRNAAAAAAVA